MEPFQATPVLVDVARRVVWLKEPDLTLANPLHFVADLMVYGAIEPAPRWSEDCELTWP